MAKLATSVLIDQLCQLLGQSTADSTARAAALVALNRSERTIAQKGSLLYLSFDTALTLANSAATVAIPATVDASKQMSLGKPSNGGELPIVPPDRAHAMPINTYGAWNANKPSVASIQNDGTGALQLRFVPTNTSGSGIVYTLTAQMLPVALTDSGSSFSTLPEGYEQSLLLRHAEHQEKAALSIPISPVAVEDLDSDLKMFVAAHRTGREVPMPDQEQAARKSAEAMQEAR